MNPNTMEKPMSTADIASQMSEHSGGAAQAREPEGFAPLLARDLTDRMQASWTNIQAGFVDEPRRAVQQADELVASAIKQLAETFARERERLESQWDRDGDVSTEDLRVAMTRYRSFFHRLLSM